MAPPPYFGHWPVSVRFSKWLEWAKSQKLPSFKDYPSLSEKVDRQLDQVYWKFERQLPAPRDQACWERLLRGRGSDRGLKAFGEPNVVDCEVARIVNNGCVHEFLVVIMEKMGWDAAKCCDPSLSIDQKRSRPPKGPRQRNNADERMEDDPPPRRTTPDTPLNYAAVSELMLEQKALKEKSAAAAAATSSSVVARSAGTGRGSNGTASSFSFGGHKPEPKMSIKSPAVNEAVRLKSNERPSLREESDISGGTVAQSTLHGMFDKLVEVMLDDPSTVVIKGNGSLSGQRQTGGSVQRESGIAATRPNSMSVISTTPIGGMFGSQPPVSKQPPAKVPVRTGGALERQAQRQLSGLLNGSLPSYPASVGRTSDEESSRLLTLSTPAPHASSSNAQQRNSAAAKTASQVQRPVAVLPAEHKMDSQTVTASTQGHTTQVESLTAEMTKKLEATINQHLLEAIRGVYRSVPKLLEQKIRDLLDGTEYRSIRFAVLREIEIETTKTVREAVMSKMKAMEEIIKDTKHPEKMKPSGNTKRKADEIDAEGGDQTQQAAKRHRSDGDGGGWTI
ncbi:hypothetical protein CORC01_03788 [Colletotrichum orchidophilum]|uniref:Uncharacterized protein n=1 Tax=Colletotrichum orchidophilum TaxID=1209926 RepID=A0A1G4BHG1_9PEZI|nr:uncharacterized protein CORC01_03788 [Colletotrichum orchidophilum]OHF00960.1 hypothetical protein CORC01_03788 [Colletotrichum orchidophilum]